MNDRLDKISVAMTNWVGTPGSLVVHTLFFAAAFAFAYFGAPLEDVLLILTTIVSLEAIYLAIFIQMTVNRQAQHLAAVGEDIEDVREEVEDLGENVEEISEDIERIHEEQAEEETEEMSTQLALQSIHVSLQKLIQDVEALKSRTHPLPPPAPNRAEREPENHSEQNYLRKLMGLIPFVGKSPQEIAKESGENA